MSRNQKISRADRFSYHTANLHSVRDALDQIDRVGKDALRRADNAATLTATRLYALLLAAEAECQLLKIINEHRVREPDRTRLMRSGNQLDRWLEAVDVGFHRHFKVAPTNNLDTALDITPRARRSVLRSAVERDLGPVIELRNDLAHGQWQYAFNSDMCAINPFAMQALRDENLRSLHHKREITNSLAHCVHDLLVSGETFERDFDSHFKNVEKSQQLLASSDYQGYVDYLRRRHAKRLNYVNPGPQGAVSS